MSSLADRIAAPKVELSSVLPDNIRNLMGDEGSFQTPAETETGFDKFNRQSFEAASGNTHAAQTAGAQIRDREKDHAKLAAKIGHRNMARSIDTTLNFKPIDLTNINLWNDDRVTITDDGTLRVADEDGQFRDATIAEQVELEDNSQACSVAVTSEERELNAFMRDLADGVDADVPESLRILAEERGIENPTRDDYEAIITETYPPRISMRIMHDGPISEIFDPMGFSDDPALTDTPVATSDPMSAVTVAGTDGNGLSSPVALQTPWNNAAPNFTPITPEPGSFTPIPTDPVREAALTRNEFAPTPPIGM